MKNKVILSLLIIVLGINTFTLIADAETQQEVITYESIPFTLANSKLRASSIVLNTGWSFGKDYCDFSIDFLRVTTGSGTVTLQKKFGNTWMDYKSLNIGFTNTDYIGTSLPVSNLSSGEYRLKFYLTADGVTETLYTWEKSI